MHSKVDRLMAHWDKLSTAQVTERRSPSPAPGTSLHAPSKRVSFEDSRYSFPNGRPRSAVFRQVNPRQVNPLMSGSLVLNRSMQGISPDARQQVGSTPSGFAGNPPLQRFPTPPPKRNAVLNVGEGRTPTLTTVRLSISCVFHVDVGATSHGCVDCAVR